MLLTCIIYICQGSVGHPGASRQSYKGDRGLETPAAVKTMTCAADIVVVNFTSNDVVSLILCWTRQLTRGHCRATMRLGSEREGM